MAKPKKIGAMSLASVKECPHCGSKDGSCYELRDHDLMWGDGRLYCKATGKFIRYYDSG